MGRAALFAPLFLSAAGIAFSQRIQVQDLGDSLKSGQARIDAARGNGAASGASVECVLVKLTDTVLFIDVFIHNRFLLVNGGMGQDMAPAMLIAFCVEFEKENPSGGVPGRHLAGSRNPAGPHSPEIRVHRGRRGFGAFLPSVAAGRSAVFRAPLL